MTDMKHNRLIDDAEPEMPAPPPMPSLAGPLPSSPTRRPKLPPTAGAYPGRRKITAYIDEQLFLRLKSISALHSKPMIEIMEEALHAFVASYAARSKFQG